MKKELYDFPEIMQHLQTSMNALSHFHSEAEFWKEKALRAERLNETLMASVTAQEEKMNELEARVLVAEHRQVSDPTKAPPPPPPPPRTRTPPSRSSSKGSSRSSASRPSPDQNGDKPTNPPKRSTTALDKNMKLGDMSKESMERNDNLLDAIGETMSSLVSNQGLGEGTLSAEMANHSVSSPKPEDAMRNNSWTNGNYTSLGLYHQGTKSDLSRENTDERDDEEEVNDNENQDDDDKSVDSDNSSVQAMRILNSYLELKNEYAKKTSPTRKITSALRPTPGRTPSVQTFEC